MNRKSGRAPRFFNPSSGLQLSEAQFNELNISFRERGMLREFVSNKDFQLFYDKVVQNFNEIKNSEDGKLADPTQKISPREYAILNDLAKLARYGQKTATNEFPGLPEKIKIFHELATYFDQHPTLVREFAAAETPRIKATLSPR